MEIFFKVTKQKFLNIWFVIWVARIWHMFDAGFYTDQRDVICNT